MNFYSITSKAYDLLDKTYFSERGNNPRKVIEGLITKSSEAVLDLCCGTLSNTITIAEKFSNVSVTGIDLSEKMLMVASKKIKKKELNNVCLKCCDATNIDIKDESFDYVVIGLILHEIEPNLRAKILKEAYRLLKNDGRLIVLEWEKQNSIVRRIKYAPLYLAEKLNCKYFKEFYKCDKEKYFNKFNFKVEKQIHCNYSVVIELRK